MNGSSTGLESADSGSTSDPRRWRNAADHFRRASTAAAQVGEWKLQREAEDAAGRCDSQAVQLEREVQQRRVDGKDPQDAREEEI